MKTSEILTKAAAIIIEKGHTKGTLEDSDGRVCLYGACFEASKELRPEMFAMYYEFTPHLVAAIGTDCDPVNWNDRPETTEAMVLGVLHEAALLAKEQGD